MDTQSYLAAAIVLVTLGVFVVRLARRKPARGCGHDCGCGKK